MRQSIFLGVSVALLCSCGNSSSPDGGTPPLSSGFAGTWKGMYSFALTGPGTYGPSAVTFPVTVSGNTATVEVCRNGNITPSGSGDSASWTGTLACPDTITLSGANYTCASVSLSFTSGTIALSNGTITVVTNGTVAGCGQSFPNVQTATGTM